MGENKAIRCFFRSFLGAVLGLFVLCAATGCNAGARGEETVRIFYLNEEKTALVVRPHALRATSEDARVEELLDLLATRPGEEALLPPVDGFARKDFSVEKNTLSIVFSGEYRGLDPITEKLTRAAIVNTMCGLENIRRVTIRVNGALLVDEHGNKSENMTDDQFIYNAGSEMLNFERTEIHLYFATGDGRKLTETYRTVVFNSNIPLERLVVEQVIGGPNGDFSYPTVNRETKVVNIVTRDDICTVTLDRSFLTNPYAVSPEVALYSIVNSLTELGNIRQVQILVEGEDTPVFMGTYTLDSEALLQKNTELVQTRE